MQYMRKQKSSVDSLGLDLLDRMLTLNPDSRITAKEALEHQYFKSDPLPCEPSEMPKIEKDCHAYTINAEKKKQAEAMNNANNANQKKGPPQNKNYNQNKPYNNNQNQNQSYHNRQQGYNNPNPNYRHNPRNSSTGHQHFHGQGHDSHSHHSSDKGQKNNNPQYNLSSNLTNLFKNENTSKIAHPTQNAPKENKNDGNRINEVKRIDPDAFTKNVESLNHKRHTNHEIDSFEQITKKRHTDPMIGTE